MRIIGTKEFRKDEKVYPYVKLESMSEVYAYLEKSNNEFSRFLKALISSEEPVRRWDHIRAEGTVMAEFYATVVNMKVNEISPYQSILDMSQLKAKGIVETFQREGCVCVNLETGTFRGDFDNEYDIVVSDEVLLELDIEQDYSEI